MHSTLSMRVKHVLYRIFFCNVSHCYIIKTVSFSCSVIKYGSKGYIWQNFLKHLTPLPKKWVELLNYIILNKGTWQFQARQNKSYFKNVSWNSLFRFQNSLRLTIFNNNNINNFHLYLCFFLCYAYFFFNIPCWKSKFNKKN